MGTALTYDVSMKHLKWYDVNALFEFKLGRRFTASK